MKRVAWAVAAFAFLLAGLVGESSAIRPQQHFAPVYTPGNGGARGDDDAPDKGQLLIVPRDMQVRARLIPTRGFDAPRPQGFRTSIVDVFGIRRWLQLHASRPLTKLP
jgi:hypothetical protein